jgi:hypothetical protein
MSLLKTQILVGVFMFVTLNLMNWWMIPDRVWQLDYIIMVTIFTLLGIGITIYRYRAGHFNR